MGKGFAVIAALALWLLASPALAQVQPAKLKLTFYDELDHPLPNLKVVVEPEKDTPGTEPQTTDAEGRVSLTVPLPVDDYATRSYRLITITRGDAPPYRASMELWDGAQLENAYSLVPTHSTIIHVRGPKGEIVSGVPLILDQTTLGMPKSTHNPIHNQPIQGYRDDRAVLDSRGDYTFIHSPFTGTLQITLGENLREDLRPIAATSSKDAPEMTFTLSGEAFAKVSPTRVLQGKLLQPDGSPASDWYVAQHIERITGGGISVGIAVRTDYYKAEAIAHPAADGTFTISNPGPYVGLISPEGFPFLYNLNPYSWADSPHRVNLTTPEVRSTQKLQFVDKAGIPAAGVTVRPTWMRSGGFLWKLDQKSFTGDGVAGSEPWRALTDDTGTLNFPRYWGAQAVNYQVGKSIANGTSFSLQNDNNSFGDKLRVTVGTTPAKAPDPVPPPPPLMSHIILSFIDQDGKPANDVQIDNFDTQVGGYERDPSGVHYFVPRKDRSALLKTKEGIYKPVDRTFDLDGSPRKTFEVILQRNKPLSGRILDTAGNPLANTEIAIYTNEKTNDGRDGFINMITSSSDGRFQIAGAPDVGTAHAYHMNRETGRSDTDVDVLPFTPDKRDLEFRLPLTSSLTLLLPPNYPLPNRMDNKIVHSLADAETRFDPAFQLLYAQIIKPGIYHLDPKEFPAFAATADLTFTIPPNTTTTIDFRNRPLAPWATVPTINTTLTVVLDGKPFSGAEVAVFADDLLPEILDPETTDSASTALAFDLSDAAGTIHFNARAGQSVVAVARVRGKLFGWQKITIPASASTIPLPIQPTRSLVFPVAIPAELAIEKPTGIERRSILRSLGDDVLYGSFGSSATKYSLPFSLKSSNTTLEPLPTGIQLTAPNLHISIPPGTGPVEVNP